MPRSDSPPTELHHVHVPGGERPRAPRMPTRSSSTTSSSFGRIEERGLDAEVSVKPTHLGLELDRDGTPHRCDGSRSGRRSSTSTCSSTWSRRRSSSPPSRLYRALLEEFENTGVCIQAYLHRRPDVLIGRRGAYPFGEGACLRAPRRRDRRSPDDHPGRVPEARGRVPAWPYAPPSHSGRTTSVCSRLSRRRRPPASVGTRTRSRCSTGSGSRTSAATRPTGTASACRSATGRTGTRGSCRLAEHPRTPGWPSGTCSSRR